MEILKELNLKIPYKSQWDADAVGTTNDCGPTSCAMVMEYFGRKTTTDEVYYKTGAGAGVINFTQLSNAVKALGMSMTGGSYKTLDDIKNLLNQGIPAIVVLHYGNLPGRQDSYQGGHILVVRGYDDKDIYTNDPDFWGDRRNEGSNKKYPIADFLKAWNSKDDGNSPGNLWYINPPSGWTYGESCEEKIHDLQQKNDYYNEVRDIVDVEEDKWSVTKPRIEGLVATEKNYKKLQGDYEDTSHKYDDLVTLYQNLLNDQTDEDAIKNLTTINQNLQTKVSELTEDLRKLGLQVTPKDDLIAELRKENVRLLDQRFTTKESVMFLLRALFPPTK